MIKIGGFTEEELKIAKSVDLIAVAERLGYTPKRIGKCYTLKEMDSIRIYNRTSWYRWSEQCGGSQIDFLKRFAGMEVKDAVDWLCDFAGYRRNDIEVKLDKIVKKEGSVEKKEFVLPEPAENNNCLYTYLNEKRGISKSVIDYFIKNNLIYESRLYHNIVFKGNDKEGNTKFASMRGTLDEYGKAFKCDVTGSNKNYGFNLLNDNSKELVVFEAAIDLMSYVEIWNDFETNKLALGMISDAPLETFLKEHPQIKKIRFCLDNDEPGRKATNQLLEKYKERAYEVADSPAPSQCKDYNEWLVAAKNYSREEKRKLDKVH